MPSLVNGNKIGETSVAGGGFEFGSSYLTIGRLTNIDERYFKGYIDELIVLDKSIENPEPFRGKF